MNGRSQEVDTVDSGQVRDLTGKSARAGNLNEPVLISVEAEKNLRGRQLPCVFLLAKAVKLHDLLVGSKEIVASRSCGSPPANASWFEPELLLATNGNVHGATVLQASPFHIRKTDQSNSGRAETKSRLWSCRTPQATQKNRRLPSTAFHEA